MLTQLQETQAIIDSLRNVDSLHCCQRDSIQKMMEDTIAYYQNLPSASAVSENSGSFTGSSLLGLIIILITALLITSLIWRLYKIIKKNMLYKRNIELNLEDDKTSFSETHPEGNHVIAISSGCIAAVASDTRKVKNQDSYCEAYVEKAKARIIAVADGVGSSFKSEEGSSYVATKAVELVKKAIETDEHHIDFDSIFDDIQAGLDAKVETEFASLLPELTSTTFGTTLILGIDFPDRFVAAYVGNGSIWHVSGLFNTFPEMVCLPWNAVNLLTPDTIMSGGKEALYKIFFYKGEKKHHKPTVLQLSKLNEAPGDMFIITTDGVYSSDHAIAGKDDDGDIWIPSTPQFGLLHDYLKTYVEGNDDINDETLKQVLVHYLAQIKEKMIMDDDTTVGVFISSEANKHFMDSRIKNEKD